MRRRTKQAVALFGTATVVTLMWPGPSSADTSLGGYSAVAQAQPIRIQIYDPTIPIPSTPQIDASIAYSKVTTDTGPSSHATASYFWPGDTIGNGLSQLVPGVDYTVRSDSNYPATQSAPAQNTAQITDGNGMTTSASDTKVTADTTGLGITGTNILSNPFKGMEKIFGEAPKPTSPSATTPQVPVQVSNALAGIVSIENMKSNSSIELGKDTVTSTAYATMSAIKLLGGLIELSGFDVTAKAVSDGNKATVTGDTTIGGITIAGQKFALDAKGIDFAGQSVQLPVLPDILKTLGISFKYLVNTKKVDGPTASLGATALQITLDTNPLKNLLNVSAIMGPIAQLLEKIPNIGSTLAGLTNLGPKIVIDIGDVSSSVTASPAYVGGAGGGTGGSAGGGMPATNGGGGVAGVGAGIGGGTTDVGTGSDLGTGSGLGGSGAVTTPDSGNAAPSLGTPQAAGFDFPALGDVPRMMILGALVLAAVLGWGLRAAALMLFGAGGNCDFGLAKGVPDLRKG